MNRVLLVHPDDDPRLGGFSREAWDQVVDLGFAGEGAYQSWSREFGCRASALPRASRDDFSRLRQLARAGRGRLLDDHGLDWWEPLLLSVFEQILQIYALQNFLDSCPADSEFFVSRPCFQSQVLDYLRPGRTRVLTRNGGMFKSLKQRLSQISRLQPRQILEIFCDKYDPDYRLRRLLSRPHERARKPVVLLPTAYGNASRTAIAYASMATELQFLLVATRHSGSISHPPANVAVAPLAAYARRKDRFEELHRIQSAWRELSDDLARYPEFATLKAATSFDFADRVLAHGLSTRDAWIRVFEEEQIRGVLCADEKNEFARIPVLLAQQRGLPAVGCHHGALDGRYLFTEIAADTFLVKGEMEKDYLVRQCGVLREKLLVGAPQPPRFEMSPNGKKTVVFFSEPYEIFGFRAEEIYQSVLPVLAQTAQTHGCSLLVKLHPFESVSDRKRLVSRAGAQAEIVSGPLADALLADTWFAVTVSSTTAVDCAMRGVPAFLCMWLDHHPFQYADQFVKFGAGRPLYSAEQITDIPRLLEDAAPITPSNLWHALEGERFTKLFTEAASRCVA